MANNIASMRQFWQGFNLPQLQQDLDQTATDLAGRQDASDISRRKLIEKSKEFKKACTEDIKKTVAPLLRSFQGEIDALSKRSKAGETDFLNLYKKLSELPDPVAALVEVENYKKKAQRVSDVETENAKLRDTLAEYNKEFAEVKNQEVTIKNLRERVRELENASEERAQQIMHDKNQILEKQFAEKEKQLQETQLLVATKLGETEQLAVNLKAALDASQTELFDLKSKYDEEMAAKQSELDMLLNDVDRATHRSEMMEKEVEELRKKLNNVSSGDKQKQTMEQAMDVISRSSLEMELTAKENEISQLVEDVQHLQSSLSKLRASSATAVANVEQELTEKTKLCEELQTSIKERSDYNDIKRELNILKSTEFSSLHKQGDDATSHNNGNVNLEAKSLEVLLLEKNRIQQSENSVLRAANAQMKGTETCSRAPTNGTNNSSQQHRVKDSQSDLTETPSSEVTNEDTLQYKLQQQQHLNTLLSLNLLANLKAAITPVSSKQLQPVEQLFSSLYNVYGLDHALIKRLYMNAIPTQNSSTTSSPEKDVPVQNKPDTLSSRLVSLASSQNDNGDEIVTSKTKYTGHSSHVGGAAWSLYKCYGDAQAQPSIWKSKAHENIDTVELTLQVKDLLQRHNIGQRAFGHYVLGLSQGSVSEILSKPKPWTKLTFKGREPFYKILDFLSSKTEVEKLKAKQRKDREDRANSSSNKNLPNCFHEKNTNEIISNILAAARNEMKREQILSHNQGVETQRTNYNTINKSRRISQESLNSEASSSTSASTSTNLCNKKLTKDHHQKMSVTTRGHQSLAFYPIVSSAESLISCHPAHERTGNEATADKFIESKSPQTTQHYTSKILIASDKVEEPKTSAVVTVANSLFNKTSVDQDQAVNDLSLVSSTEGNHLYNLSIAESVLTYPPSSTSSKNVQHIYATRTYNDPFIPPPMSPIANETALKFHTNTTDSSNYDSSPFLSGQNSTYKDKEKQTPTEKTFATKTIKEESNIPQETGMYMQDQALFRELSSAGPIDQDVPHFSDREMNKSPDSNSSYAELHTVKTESFFIPQQFTNQPQGISSMLPPLTNEAVSPQSKLANLKNILEMHRGNYEPNTVSEELSTLDFEESSFNNMINPLNLTSLSYMDTLALTKSVKDILNHHGICQRVFGEKVLGLSQGTVSDILSRPKDWNKLTHKGREPFARMILWLSDPTFAASFHLMSTTQKHQPNFHQNSDHNKMLLTANQHPEQPFAQHHSYSPNMHKDHGKGAVSPCSDSNTDSSSSSSIMPSMTDNFNNNASSHIPQKSKNSKKKNIKRKEKLIDMATQEGVVTPLQQMLNIQELAASWPKLDTFSLTRRVKDLLTEHNIGQRIFGQAVLGLTQGSVSDLLSRPKVWHSLSLKGREPFVRMQLWLSDPKNIEQLKNLKLERWMEKKWVGKRRRTSSNSTCPVTGEISPQAKKQRIKLTSQEKEVLRASYVIEPYPSQETVDLLARKLHLKSSTIVNWFHNYRSRVKRGFFPSEKFNDNISSVLKSHSINGSHGKLTVKELLDNIILPTTSSSSSKTSSQSNSSSSRKKTNTANAPMPAWSNEQYAMSSTHDVNMINASLMAENILEKLNESERQMNDLSPVSSKAHLQQTFLPSPYLHTSTSVIQYDENEHEYINNTIMHPSMTYAQLKPKVENSDVINIAMAASIYNDDTSNASISPGSQQQENNNMSLASLLPPVYTFTQNKPVASPGNQTMPSGTNISLPSASSLLPRSENVQSLSPSHPVYMRSHSDSATMLCSNSNGNNNNFDETNSEPAPYVEFDGYDSENAYSVNSITTSATTLTDTTNDLYSWVF